jgi:hypothetical protein
MRCFALSLALMGAVLVVCSATTVFPGRLMAFELERGAATVSGATTQFHDPDETPRPALLPSPLLDDEGTSLRMTPGTSNEIAPGLSLQIAPSNQSTGNPADNRALIPSP